MRQNVFFFKISMGYQKKQNFMLIQRSLKWAQNVLEESYRQKLCTFLVYRILHCFQLFFANNFLRNIFGPFQRIWNKHKTLRFFILHNNFLTKVFWSNLHLLQILNA
jgi:hypothetical protein